MTLVSKYATSKIIKEEQGEKKKNRTQDNISKLLTEIFLLLARDSSKGVTDSSKISRALSLHPTVKAKQPAME